MKPHQNPALNSKAFTCCFCFHVKTGTLIYAILSVLAHFILLGVIVFAAIHPDVLITNKQPEDGIVVGSQGQPDTDDVLLQSYEKLDDQKPSNYRWTKDNMCVAFGMTLAWIMSVLALIYGVVKNQASYLMPCFCIQVFDFCLTCLVVVSSFTFASDANIHGRLHHWKLEEFPGLKHLHAMDRDFLMLLTVAVLFFVLAVKAYLMGMVWSCYRYIQLHVASRSQVREYAVDPVSEMLLPPRYEDAIKIPSHVALPPAYNSQ